MSHLEFHEHAFLDSNNVVINIAVFDESAHDSGLLNDVLKVTPNAVKVICCCTFGAAFIGQSWDESTSSWLPLPVLELPEFSNENA
jgi:hypothetical protein